MKFKIILFLVVGLLAHGLLILNDGDYGDGWFLEYNMQKGHLEGYLDHLKESGSHGYALIHEAFGEVSMSFYKFGMFLNILMISGFIYILLVRYTNLKDNHALFVGLLTLVWPYYHLSVNTTFFPVWIVQTAFYAGWVLFLWQRTKGGVGVIAFVSYFLMFFSFHYNALLVYHFVIIGVYFLYLNEYPKSIKKINFRLKLPGFLKDHWFLMILPLLFWGMKKMFFMPYGTLRDYNVIQIFSFRTLESYFKYIKHILLDLFEAVLFIELPVGSALIAVILIVIVFYKKFGFDKADSKIPGYAKNLMVLGFLMICALAFPFSVVGKHPDLYNSTCRHGVLASLGFGLFLIGFLNCIFLKNRKWQKWENLILCQIIICLVFLDINFYSSWQARAVKDTAVVSQLKKMGPLDNVGIYFMRDKMPRGVDPSYEYNDVTLMLYEAWGKEEYMGISLFGDKNPNLLRYAREAVENWRTGRSRGKAAASMFDPNRCMGELILTPMQKKQEVATAFKYLYFKNFDKNKMDALLNGLVQVELKPLYIDYLGESCR